MSRQASIEMHLHVHLTFVSYLSALSCFRTLHCKNKDELFVSLSPTPLDTEILGSYVFCTEHLSLCNRIGVKNICGLLYRLTSRIGMC